MGNFRPEDVRFPQFTVQEEKMHYKCASMLKTKLRISGWSLSSLLLLLAASSASLAGAHEHLCLEDDYTNDLPIFIEKRTICNFDQIPVHVYSVKITPDTDYETKLCLKGGYSQIMIDLRSLVSL